MIRLWLAVLVMTAISWVILKVINRPKHIGLVFLFWVVAIWGAVALIYGVSVLVSTQPYDGHID